MKYAPEEVQAYLDAVTDERKTLFTLLHDTITEMYPTAVKRIAYQILEFRVPTGKVFLGYRKDGVSLYTGHIQRISEFRLSHPSIKTGKGCLNFTLKTDIPWDDVKALIRYAMEYMAET